MTTNPLARIAARNGGTDEKRTVACRRGHPRGRPCRRDGVGADAGAGAANLPDYLAAITGTTPQTPPALATRDVLQLNTSMFALYDNAAKIFQANILARHPLILALFSGAGGRMILYRPGKPPEEAPSVPIVYQIMKSTGHSTMAISEVVMPFVGNAADKSWMAPMLAYRTQMKTALDGVDILPIQDDWKPGREEHPGQQRRLHG